MREFKRDFKESKKFGETLKSLRLSHNDPMRTIGELLDVSTPYISDVEKGLRAPLAPEKILKVAKHYKTSPNQLLAQAIKARGFLELPINTQHQVDLAVFLCQTWDKPKLKITARTRDRK